jgi:hypothetical protein
MVAISGPNPLQSPNGLSWSHFKGLKSFFITFGRNLELYRDFNYDVLLHLNIIFKNDVKINHFLKTLSPTPRALSW